MSPIVLALLGVPVATACYVCCRQRPVAAAVAIVGVITFGEEVLSLFFRLGVPAGVDHDLLASKDLLCWILVIALSARNLAHRRRSIRVVTIVCGYVGVLVLFLAFRPSPAPRVTQIEGIRSALVPILGFAAAALLTRDERIRCSARAIPVVAIGAALSLAQLLLPAGALRTGIGVGTYWSVVKQVPLFVDPTTGLPGNFYTSTGFPRLSGTFGDPLSAGEVLGTFLVLAVAYRSCIRYPRAQITVLASALLLTFTRDGWLIAVFGLVALSVTRGNVIATIRRICAGAILAALAIIAISPVRAYVLGIANNSDASTRNHYTALATSVGIHFPLLGNGWGTGGAFARQSYAAAVASESAFVALLQEIGWIGTAGALLALGFAIATVVHREPMRKVVVAIVLAEVVSGFVSENLLSFNGGLIPLMALPLIVVAPPTGCLVWPPGVSLHRRLSQRALPRTAGQVAPDPSAIVNQDARLASGPASGSV